MDMNIEFTKRTPTFAKFGHTLLNVFIEGEKYRYRFSCGTCGAEHVRKSIANMKPKCKKCMTSDRTEEEKKTIRAKIVKTNMERFGVATPLQNEAVKEKVKVTVQKKYGVDNVFAASQVKEKSKQTCMAKYGTEWSSQNKEVQQKRKDTMIERYGEDNPMKVDMFVERLKETNNKRYGGNAPTQNPAIKEKVRQTTQDHYNVDNPFQSEEVKYKMRQTNIDRYGFPYAIQNEEVYNKMKRNMYTIKDYMFPSGRVVQCQGYEPIAIDLLLNEYHEDDIIVQPSTRFPYYYINCKRYYHPDIFVNTINRKFYIEVKSTYTFKCDKEKNIAKMNAVIERGDDIELWIFDKKRELVEKLTKHNNFEPSIETLLEYLSI